jgi:cell pole-organizing protein PopZ
MSTQERNYRKNPHTARWLMAFHAAAAGLPADLDGENDYMTPAERGLAEEIDLLNEIPVDANLDRRSPRQAELMTSLVAQITELDAELGARTGEWIAKATAAGHWTPGREGNASAWITKMIDKVRELKAAAKATPSTPAAEVANGRYAVEEDGVLKFFKVTNGKRAGFVFLDVQASDEWHAIRNVARIRKIVALIAEDAHAAMIRYGHELGECGRCGRTLTDEASRAAGIGPICASK